jgi:hypothetical protein
MQKLRLSRLGPLALLAAGSIAVAACETAVVAAPELPTISATVVENSRNPFVFFIPPCNGEAIEGSGIFHLVVSSTVTPSGRVSGTFHINAKGKGVGLVTGAKYEWNDAINESFSFDSEDGAPFTDTFTQNFRLIGQSDVPDRRINVRFHITINANGEVTSFKFEFSDTCP